MPQFFVIKSTGEKAPFNLEKVKATCRRSGANPKLCDHVAKEVEARVFNGITTKEIFQLVLEELNKEHPGVAARYCLRDAILKLGPMGFDFEKYIAKLLEAYGYRTEFPPLLQGLCTMHEVDIIAEKDNRKSMVECKFRHSVDIFVTLKDVMATWARFLDLVDASVIGQTPHLDECWIITNSRFSTEALQYGHCKNIVMLSWNHPKERPLPAWIDSKRFYPLTVIRDLAQETQKKLIEAGIILVQDLAETPLSKIIEIARLKEETAKNLLKLARQILQE
jgi:hypothetical protein